MVRINLFLGLSFLGILFLSGCKDNHQQKSYSGYVEGKYTYLSSRYPGVLKSIDVALGDAVTKNQVLYSLDSQPEKDEQLEVESRITEAKTNQSSLLLDYELKQSIFNRKKGLYAQKVIPQTEFDSAENSFKKASFAVEGAKQNVAALEGKLRKIQWTIKQKTALAPTSGTVSDLFYNEGENVASDTPVLSLLSDKHIKFIFYLPETMLSKIKINQMVTIDCDGCMQPLKAKITFINSQAEYTPPIIYSKETQARLMYHIEAIPLVSNTTKINPGQPISVKLTDKSHD